MRATIEKRRIVNPDLVERIEREILARGMEIAARQVIAFPRGSRQLLEDLHGWIFTRAVQVREGTWPPMTWAESESAKVYQYWQQLQAAAAEGRSPGGEVMSRSRPHRGRAGGGGGAVNQSCYGRGRRVGG